MANNFTNVELYQRALDTALVHESKSEILKIRNPEAYLQVAFTKAGVVKIPKGSSSQLANYKPVNSGTYGVDYVHNHSIDGGDGFKRGDVKIAWEDFSLQFDRAREFQIDRVENWKTGDIPLEYITTRFQKESVVPEIDACRFAYLASVANESFGTKVSQTPTADGGANDIYTLLTNAFATLFDMGVADEDQVIFVNPEVYALIQSTSKLTRFLTVRDVPYKDINLKVEFFNGRPLIQVPSDRFYDKITLSNEGYGPSSDAKSINFMVVSAKSTLVFDLLSTFLIYDSNSTHLGFDGWAVDYHLYHGIWVPENKVPSVYVSLGASLNKNANASVFVSTVAGSASGTTQVTKVYTQPASIYVDRVAYDTSDHAIGSTISSPKIATLNTDITVSGTTLYFFGLASDNTVVAKSRGAVTVNKKA